MRLALLLIAVVGILAGGQALFRRERASAQGTTVIDVGDLWFCAQSFGNGVCETTVAAGDTVQWRWTGAFVHTTTECAGDLDVCPEPHLWDSPPLATGTFSFTFNTPGTYVYRCQVHPSSMRGRITVLAPTATPTPTPAPTAAASPSPTVEGSGGAPSRTPVVAVVPAGGGVPPSDGPGGPPPWWLVLAGVALVGAAGLAVLKAARP